jgi:hypothetical protein
MNHERKLDLRGLAEKWPSTLVARTEVGRFSGGLLNEKSMANHDSAGTGVKDRIRIGRKICYSVDSLINWLESRISEVK